MRSANFGVLSGRKARVKPNRPEEMGFRRKAPQFNVRERARVKPSERPSVGWWKELRGEICGGTGQTGLAQTIAEA
jgi:hypothetical protein